MIEAQLISHSCTGWAGGEFPLYVFTKISMRSIEVAFTLLTLGLTLPTFGLKHGFLNALLHRMLSLEKSVATNLTQKNATKAIERHLFLVLVSPAVNICSHFITRLFFPPTYETALAVFLLCDLDL